MRTRSGYEEHERLRFRTTVARVSPLLERLARGKAYARFLAITDDPREVVEFIRKRPSERN